MGQFQKTLSKVIEDGMRGRGGDVWSRYVKLIEFLEWLSIPMVESFGERTPQEVVHDLASGRLEMNDSVYQVAIVCFCARQGWVPFSDRTKMGEEVLERAKQGLGL